MTYKEYIEKYVGEDVFCNIKDYSFNYNQPINTFDDEVSIKGIMVELKNITNILGFKKEYSVESTHPELLKVWSKSNIKKPSEVFYLSPESIVINDGEEMVVSIGKYIESLFSKEEVLFLSVEKFEEAAVVFEKSKTVLVEKYKRMREYFNLKKDNEEKKLPLSKKDWEKYFSQIQILSTVTKYMEKIHQNMILSILEVGYRVEDNFFDINIMEEKLTKKDELLSLLNTIGDPRVKYLVYGIYLGLGKDNLAPLRYLKFKDIDEINMIAISETEKGKEIFYIDEDFLAIAEECYELDKYLSINSSSGQRRVYHYNMNSEYILKTKRSRLTEDGLKQISYNTASVLLRQTQELLGIDEKFKVFNLELSRCLNQMKEIHDKKDVAWDENTVETYRSMLGVSQQSDVILEGYRLLYGE